MEVNNSDINVAVQPEAVNTENSCSAKKCAYFGSIGCFVLTTVELVSIAPLLIYDHPIIATGMIFLFGATAGGGQCLYNYAKSETEETQSLV